MPESVWILYGGWPLVGVKGSAARTAAARDAAAASTVKVQWPTTSCGKESKGVTLNVDVIVKANCEVCVCVITAACWGLGFVLEKARSLTASQPTKKKARSCGMLTKTQRKNNNRRLKRGAEALVRGVSRDRRANSPCLLSFSAMRARVTRQATQSLDGFAGTVASVDGGARCDG